MSTNPTPPNPNPATQTPAVSAQEWIQALSAWATQSNATLIAEYEQGLATAKTEGIAPPTPPLLYSVNGPLILQIENQENASPGSTTAAQWADIITQAPMPAPAPAPATPSVTLTLIAAGLWKVTVNSGFGPSDGQVFAVDGVNYKAEWVGPFGPVICSLA